MPGSFFDTNVILYQLTDDIRKADRSEELVRAGGSISVQVLNELVNVARRRLRLPWPIVEEQSALFRGLLTVLPLTVETHRAGLHLGQRYGFSPYDSMIVAAALEADCDTLWSEDMHDGLRVDDRLIIRNPFA